MKTERGQLRGARGEGRGIHNRPRAAFSLPDLLLVAAVLALIAAVVVPVVAKSRQRARLEQCLVNLKQITGAVLAYANDHNQTLPVTKSIPAPGGWWTYKEEVKRYAGLVGPSSARDSVFACPDDRGYGVPGEPLTPFSRSAKHNFTSYVFNGVTLPGIPNVSGKSLASIQNPKKTLLVMEWPAHGPLSWHRSRTGRANDPFYDGAESVAGFVDGHVSLTRFYYDGINAAYTRDPIPGYEYKFSAD